MKEKISAKQLFSAIILVPLGSAVLFFITPDVKQNAWLAKLIYTIGGVILQIVYTSLWKKYPEDTLVTYMPKIFGKLIGYTLSIIYTIFFAYEAARVLRDFAELILISLMPRQSLILISILLTLIVCFSLYLGMEVMSRASYIFLCLWLFFFAIEWLFLFTTPSAVKFSNLKPLLENGIIPVITKAWKLITFPFGESILFVMFFPYVVERSKVRKASILGIIVQGILLSLTAVLFIIVLGVDYASTSLFPLLQVLRVMKIGETFDRVDVFGMLIIVLIGFIKVSFYTYGAMIGTAQLLKLKNTRKLAVPFSLIILITSLLIARNYPQHIYIGQVLTLTYVHLPLTVFIPIITLIVYYLKLLNQKFKFISKLKNKLKATCL